MKITMLCVSAGPNGIAPVGRVVDLPAAEAKEWIDGRYARPFDAEQDSKRSVGFDKAKDE